MAQRRLGVKQALIDGVVIDVKSVGGYSLGGNKLETVMGVDRAHGQKVTRIVAYLEMMLTDNSDLDLKALTGKTDSTIVVDLENGKTLQFAHACYAGEGKVTPEEGEIDTRWECDPEYAQEI